MKLYKSIDLYTPVKGAVVTIGTFDGVHIGHKKILSRLRELADNDGSEVVLLTFFPHPRMVLYPDDHGVLLLNTLDEKIELLADCQVDHLIIHPFTRDFSRISSVNFVRDILIGKLGMKKLIIGYDHHFGRNREGSFEELKEMSSLYGYEVEEIPEQDIDEVAVSSTKIRKALLEGDLDTAMSYLGHDYTLSGIVVEGNKVGRKLGFPTANIKVKEDYKLIPCDGVYATDIKIAETTYQGMLYIGYRPTLDGKTRSIEVNIFNFDENIYGQNLTLNLKCRIRGEMRFPDLESLRIQLQKDKDDAIKAHSIRNLSQ